MESSLFVLRKTIFEFKIYVSINVEFFSFSFNSHENREARNW